MLRGLFDPLGTTTVLDFHFLRRENAMFERMTSAQGGFESDVHGTSAPNLVTLVALPIARRIQGCHVPLELWAKPDG